MTAQVLWGHGTIWTPVVIKEPTWCWCVTVNFLMCVPFALTGVQALWLTRGCSYAPCYSHAWWGVGMYLLTMWQPMTPLQTLLDFVLATRDLDLSFYASDFQMWLYIKVTWGTFKKYRFLSPICDLMYQNLCTWNMKHGDFSGEG
jgi:hypothetical protein